MSLTERLRGVVRGSAGAYSAPALPSAATGGVPASLDLAADLLGGEWHESRGHRFLVVERTYLPGHRHGRVALADALPSSTGLWPRLSLLAGAACQGNAMFVDLETTGLAGGAGTYAFLIGCAWFDGGTFRVRQFFLASFGAERGLLERVAELADAAGTIVTYNGKTFDLPLMESRFVLHRMDTPFAGMPHLDMLHPARRLWRSDTQPDDTEPLAAQLREVGSCRLSVLEQTLCGHERDGDVPGFEIPARYFRYVRSGDARPLSAVFEHNRLDLLALAFVTARAAQLLEEGAAGTRTAREAFGLGRLFERAGMTPEAHECFALAADRSDDDAVTGAQALAACAALLRRERRYQEAAVAWRRLLELRRCPANIAREATLALAVHHEHRLRDPQAARAFVLQSLPFQGTVVRRQAVHHRLARLNRKLGDSSAAVPLF